MLHLVALDVKTSQDNILASQLGERKLGELSEMTMPDTLTARIHSWQERMAGEDCFCGHPGGVQEVEVLQGNNNNSSGEQLQFQPKKASETISKSSPIDAVVHTTNTVTPDNLGPITRSSSTSDLPQHHSDRHTQSTDFRNSENRGTFSDSTDSDQDVLEEPSTKKWTRSCMRRRAPTKKSYTATASTDRTPPRGKTRTTRSASQSPCPSHVAAVEKTPTPCHHQSVCSRRQIPQPKTSTPVHSTLYEDGGQSVSLNHTTIAEISDNTTSDSVGAANIIQRPIRIRHRKTTTSKAPSLDLQETADLIHSCDEFNCRQNTTVDNIDNYMRLLADTADSLKFTVEMYHQYGDSDLLREVISKQNAMLKAILKAGGMKRDMKGDPSPWGFHSTTSNTVPATSSVFGNQHIVIEDPVPFSLFLLTLVVFIPAFMYWLLCM